MIPLIRNRHIGGGANGRNSAFVVAVDTRHAVPATPGILAQELAEWDWHWSRGWILSRLVGRFSPMWKLRCNAFGMAVTVAWEGWDRDHARKRANILHHAYANGRVTEAECRAMVDAYRPDAEAWCTRNRARVEEAWRAIT